MATLLDKEVLIVRNTVMELWIFFRYAINGHISNLKKKKKTFVGEYQQKNTWHW